MSKAVYEKYYELYNNKAPELIIKVLKYFKVYEVNKLRSNVSTLTYYDTALRLLHKVDILISKNETINGTTLRIERDLEGNPRADFIKKIETIEFEKAINAKDDPKAHAKFLGDNFPRLIQQPFTFDIYRLFDDLCPQLIIKSRNECYRVVAGNGFTCLFTFEDVIYYNVDTKRENYVLYLHVEQISEDKGDEDYKKIIERLEAYCKFIFEIHESKYKQGTRLTKPLELPNKKKKEKYVKEKKKKDELVLKYTKK